MATEVILLERVESLGQMGDVVRVKPGFARNFLLPQRKALRATKENRAYFDKQRAQLEAQNLARKGEAEQVAAKMGSLAVIIIRQAGNTGQLYGSVSSRDVADAVTAAGYTVGRQQVLMQQPIKALGVHKTRLALHPEVVVEIKVNVALSEEEAKLQAEGKTPAPVAAVEAAPAPAEAVPVAATEKAAASGDEKKAKKGKAKKADA
jgi:large subunit ribosomal protein L9